MQSNSGSAFSKMFTNPSPDLYHIVMYTAFLVVLVLSIVTVVREVVQYQAGDYIKMGISALITIILGGTIIRLVFIFKDLRYGKYSAESFRKTWCDLLNKCNTSDIKF